MCMHDMHTIIYGAQVDMHGAMAHMHEVHMQICGAMALRQGVHGCHGTLHGSKGQVKHTVHMFLHGGL